MSNQKPPNGWPGGPPATPLPYALAMSPACMYLSLPCVGDCVAPARRGLPLWRNIYLLTYESSPAVWSSSRWNGRVQTRRKRR